MRLPPLPIPAIRSPIARCTRGVALVEFAFVLPIFSMLLFGILMYGNYFYLSHNIQQLANDAARSTIAGLTAAERTTLATDTARIEATNGLSIDSARLQVQVTDQADFLTVKVSYDASNQALFKLGLLPTPNPIVARTAAVRKGGL